MDNRSIGEQVTDEIINEQFPTRQMQIDHLKEVSETIKNNPDLKETIKKELSSNPTNQTKEEKFQKTKSLILSKLMNKTYNGFASLLVLCLTVFMMAGGSLFYILLTNGFFK